MAEVVGIVGESGSGKSTSYHNLNPATTFLLNSDRKSLPFRGWKADYNGKNKNYIHESSFSIVKKAIELANANPAIKSFIWDTANTSMIDDEMGRVNEKGYDKWMDLAQNVWNIVTYITTSKMRPDLIVYILFHAESYFDEDGIRTIRIKTNGRKLQKIDLETKLRVVLYTKVEQEGEGKNKFYFITQKDGNTGKSPIGMFKEFKIPNDLALVDKAIREYDGDEPIEYRNNQLV